MSTTTSTRPSRSALPRSLPTLTVFTHPAARLVKTVPQLQPPARVNGHVPRDTLGVGRASSSDVVLTHVYGPLSILVVPDPLDPTIATLVLSVGFQDALLHGAARRFVLPFRSFQRDQLSGQLISQSKIKGFDAAHRSIYPGLGAGLKGLDGGSFWFFEDVGEQGAFDRYRWEKDGVGRRAIWTVWLISTPAPVVLHVQNLLQSYPASVPPLPPWLKQNNGFPWQDSYIALNQAPNISLPIHEDKIPPNIDGIAAEPSSSPTAPISHRSLPSIPHSPTKPEPFFCVDKHEASQLAPAATPKEIDGHVSTSHTFEQVMLAANHQLALADGVTETTLANAENTQSTPTKSKLSVRSKHLRDGSSSVTIGDAPEVILRGASRAATIPQYRNSLVAVDNLTGQIIGVLASHINLDSPPTDPTQIKHTDSSDEAKADVEEEDEAQTPLDEHTRILQHKAPELVLGLNTDQALLSKSSDDPVDNQDNLVTPQASAFVYRPMSVYRDAATTCIPSRPPSILAADTFAPPPLPPKHSALRGARIAADSSADAAPSRRTSTASAAFFSADSDAEAMSSYDSDALEIDARTITHDNLPASFISIRGKAANDIERHRPELLQDHDADDGAASDASGSTVGGPAVRMWRKARGKTKKKPGSKAAAVTSPSTHTHIRQSLKSRQASELSDRTSKAETALEGLSDIDANLQAEQEAPANLDSAHNDQSDAMPIAEDRTTPLHRPKTGPGYHLPRTALRTDEVRSIEDRVWREALDGGQLPIDAPYTHLAARGDAGFYPSSILSSPRSFADGSAIELLSAEDKARESRKKKEKQHQQNQRAERLKNMQGGTVLIEFLAGSSRIGASLIRSAGLHGGSADLDRTVKTLDAEIASKSDDLGSNVLGYVPLLPQHLLSFFGLVSSITSPSAAKDNVDLSSSRSEAPAATAASSSYLPSLRLPAFGGLLNDASDWVSNLFTFNTSAPSSFSTRTTEADAPADLSKAEEWEYAIPDFDPNSMASTPRPIYRRKRPIPSAMNGFNINKLNVSPSTEAYSAPKSESSSPQPQPGAGSAVANEQRYSILHIDSLGIGRRAFLRGMPELEGLRF
ncbi:related to conserved hypothetcial protein [Ustilago trichophora]|uniref:Related to conserved hypothetcial protein n=1 Tax=Ustilago trichophora TaxID=86804 RepID=A0A5C3EMI9_9BASI|nr:related to conserved hypothetcial protein [Ustilago trichophora]